MCVINTFSVSTLSVVEIGISNLAIESGEVFISSYINEEFWSIIVVGILKV